MAHTAISEIKLPYTIINTATSNSTAEKEAFLGHIEQVKQVARQVYSPHLIRMIGCVTMYDPLCLVTELPANGDLLTYLVTSRRMVNQNQPLTYARLTNIPCLFFRGSLKADIA